MEQSSYEAKLAQLTDIFQGDAEYAKTTLDKWLQKNRADFEAQIIAEVSRRLDGLNSIVPVTLKIMVDSQGVRLPGLAAVSSEAKTSTKKERHAAAKKNNLFEP
ncbi:MAG TPA: hypothetical protein DCY27_05175 [Desulfobacterales bacterium]|nr:hypothetical protein [Desulfobacterales bacterium]